MKNSLKAIHIIAITIFFGSIATYIYLGILVPENYPEALALNRQWIAACTGTLTIPALWITGFTGILLSGKPQNRWLWAKLIGFGIAAFNTQVFIYPAILKSVATVESNPTEFQSAMQQEALFGAINVLLILLLIGFAIAKPKLGQNRAVG